ncbi:MAG: peptide deformylase [Gemmatimonadaceae bacterium]
MSLLELVVLGDPILRRETRPVEQVTDELRRLADDMLETMYTAQGIGLAAPQVGRFERLAVVHVSEEDEAIVLVNPQIVVREGTARGEEGCLSIPEVYADVERAARVVVTYLDRGGRRSEIDASDLLGRCLQHEIDHLDGKLFIDYLSVLKRRSAMQKWATVKGAYPRFRRILTAGEVAAHHRTANDEL